MKSKSLDESQTLIDYYVIIKRKMIYKDISTPLLQISKYSMKQLKKRIKTNNLSGKTGKSKPVFWYT